VWAKKSIFVVVMDGIFVPCQIVFLCEDGLARLSGGRIDAATFEQLRFRAGWPIGRHGLTGLVVI
jgi:hypothetical protein